MDTPYRVPGIPRIAVDRAGNGPLVLFMHGIGGNRGNWRDQLPAFAANHACVSWDARGYGASDDYDGPLAFDDFVADVLDIDPARDHRPCPFAGGWYQWMRNLVAARALARHHQVQSAFVVVYTDGSFPMALGVGTAEWARLEALTAGRAVPFRKISYQRLHALASAAASQGDRRVLADLSEWMARKLTAALAKGEF
jgi:pimeloyl-ACP methyl ester carboxylesterase